MIVSNKKVNKTKIKLKSLDTGQILIAFVVFAIWWKKKENQLIHNKSEGKGGGGGEF